MDLPPAWCQACVCGRTFSVPQAYTCHKRSCQKTKKRLAGALEKAKEVWQAKKRRKMGEMAERQAPESRSNCDLVAGPVLGGDPVSVAPEVRLAFRLHCLR